MSPNCYSISAYRNLLRLARTEGYRFIGFRESWSAADRVILLRHDVDYSMAAAVEMARVNAEEGIAATFFLLLRSQVYNLLSAWSLARVGELLDLGQRVALHVALRDGGFCSLESLTAQVANDHQLLRAHGATIEPVFSWHNPTADLLEQTRDWHPAGLLNAYHRQFAGDIGYFSDSNFRNSVRDLEKAIQAGDRALQLLLHPINWVAGGESMIDVLSRAWSQVIREREEEIRTNRVYQAVFPDGMPEATIQLFTDHWLQSARAEAG